MRLGTWAEVPEVSGDLPVEQHVLHLWPSTDVVHDHVATVRFLVHDDADVRDTATQIPGDEVAGRVIFGAAGNGQSLPFPFEKPPEVWPPSVVDVGIRTNEQPSPSVRVGPEILQHVFVNFSLQIDAHGPV